MGYFCPRSNAVEYFSSFLLYLPSASQYITVVPDASLAFLRSFSILLFSEVLEQLTGNSMDDYCVSRKLQISPLI